jgi:hypothetical protein
MGDIPASPAKPSTDDDFTLAGRPSFLASLKTVNEAATLCIGLIGLLAGVPGAVGLLAAHWGMPLWLAGAAGVVLALLFLLWLMPRWLDWQNRRRAIEFGIHGHVKDPEYFRLTPYDAASDFRRADNAHEKVYGWLVGNPAPLLYLSGASGSGKSSIISGWVLPRLAQQGVPICVVTARVVGNPITAVTQALLKREAIWERPPTDGKLGLRDLLERAARKVAPKKLLLVLDQFEEFLIVADDEQRHVFSALLRGLAESPLPNLQVLMILRSDYRPLLDTLGLPELEQDRKEVPPFRERDAMAFLRESGLQLSPELESEICTEAREVEQTPGLIRPITVNLFGLVLHSFEALPKNYCKGTRLRSYLRDLIERKDIRNFAPLILRCMMTGNGTKIPVTYTEVARTVGLDPNQVRGCLVQLANEGVLRELDRNNGKWEIAHDFIAALYYQILAGWRTSVWRRARPWVIGGGMGLWLLAVLMVPPLLRDWQEARDQQALTDLGFTSSPCYQRDQGGGSSTIPGCLVWLATDKVKPSVLAAAMPLFKKFKKIGLDLTNTKIDNIDVLSGLTNLKILNLERTDVRNIDALRSLTSLQSLSLDGTKIENIEALKSLTSLQTLSLNRTRVDNIDALKGLTGLQSLGLSLTKVENIDVLKGLIGLQDLGLGYTKVKNIDALRGLVGLQDLFLSGVKVENIDAIRGLTRIKLLFLDSVGFNSIDALKGLKALKTLSLGHTDVKNIDALKGLTVLQDLDLNNTKVESIDALKDMTALQTLNLDHTHVKNIDALGGLAALQTLAADYTDVANISALKDLTGLQNLGLNSTKVENVDALKGLTGLTVLDLQGTRIHDTDTLKGLTNLTRLGLPTRFQNVASLKAAFPGATLFFGDS